MFFHTLNTKRIKKEFVIGVVVIGIALVQVFMILLVSFLMTSRSNYYFKKAQQATETNDKILYLEISSLLKTSPETNTALGNLYFEANNLEASEEKHNQALAKKETLDSRLGIIKIALRRGDFEKAKREAGGLPTEEKNCIYSYVGLVDYHKSLEYFKEAGGCKSFSQLRDYFQNYRSDQAKEYLKLSATKQHYQDKYVLLANQEIMALLKEKNDYRDAYVLASLISRSLGETLQADQYKKEVLNLDPSYDFSYF